MDIQTLVDLIADSLENEGLCPVCGQGFVCDMYYLGGRRYWECFCCNCSEVYAFSESIL